MYKVGQSKNEAFTILGIDKVKRNENFQNPNSPDVEAFSLNSDVKPLQTYQNVMIWSGQLLKNGRNIDDKTDELFNKVIVLSDGTFSSARRLKKVLKELLLSKDDVRNFEIDVEEFMHVVSITEHLLDSNLPTTAFQVLTQVNNTYKNVYDLTKYKLQSISSSRVTATNILISIMALIISIYAVYISK